VWGLLRHGENAWLVPPGNAEALAEAIRTLRRDATLRARLAGEAQAAFRRHCAPQRVGEILLAILEPLIGTSQVPDAIPPSCGPES